MTEKSSSSCDFFSLFLVWKFGSIFASMMDSYAVWLIASLGAPVNLINLELAYNYFSNFNDI